MGEPYNFAGSIGTKHAILHVLLGRHIRFRRLYCDDAHNFAGPTGTQNTVLQVLLGHKIQFCNVYGYEQYRFAGSTGAKIHFCWFYWDEKKFCRLTENTVLRVCVLLLFSNIMLENRPSLKVGLKLGKVDYPSAFPSKKTVLRWKK